MSHAKDQAALSKTTEQQDLVFRESDFPPLLAPSCKVTLIYNHHTKIYYLGLKIVRSFKNH